MKLGEVQSEGEAGTLAEVAVKRQLAPKGLHEPLRDVKT
jgi:hypothetical protein